MSGVDPVEFLRNQLKEDEAAARRVESSWRQIGETGVIVASDGNRAEECANGNWTGIAEHIVRHDPARVLAEVEVKREIVKLHGPAEFEYSDVDVCLTCDSGGPIPYPCPTLRLLALPYADHPDYREEWRP